MTSANRQTRIQLLIKNPEGVEESEKKAEKTLSLSVNYYQKDFPSLVNALQRDFRTSKEDPYYAIDQLKYKSLKDGAFVVFDESRFEEIKDEVLSTGNINVIRLKAYVRMTETEQVYAGCKKLRQSIERLSHYDENTSDNTRDSTFSGSSRRCSPLRRASPQRRCSPQRRGSPMSQRRSSTVSNAVSGTTASAIADSGRASSRKTRPSSPRLLRKPSPSRQAPSPSSTRPQSPVKHLHTAVVSNSKSSVKSSGKQAAAGSLTPGGFINRPIRTKDRTSPTKTPKKTGATESTLKAESSTFPEDGTAEEPDEIAAALDSMCLTDICMDDEEPTSNISSKKLFEDETEGITGKSIEEDINHKKVAEGDNNCNNQELVGICDEVSDVYSSCPASSRPTDDDCIFDDLPEGEEPPDMGHNVWRESIGCGKTELQEYYQGTGDHKATENSLTDTEAPANSIVPSMSQDESSNKSCNDTQQFECGTTDSTPSKTSGVVSAMDAVDSMTTSDIVMSEDLLDPVTPSEKTRSRSASTTKKRSPRASRRDTSATKPKLDTKQRMKELASTMTSSSSAVKAYKPSYLQSTSSSRGGIDIPTAQCQQVWQKSLRSDNSSTLDRMKSHTHQSKGRKATNSSVGALKAMRHDTKGLEEDGRPSYATMTAQWEFLRGQFMENDNEKLEWAMAAKEGGEKAYKKAFKKSEMAEDQYYKALYDIDVIQSKLQLIQGSDLASILKEMTSCESTLRINPHDPDSCATVNFRKESLRELVEGDLKGICCVSLDSKLKDIYNAADANKSAMLAKTVLAHQYPAELSGLKERLKTATTASNESLAEFEKWSTRLKETAHYAIVQADEDADWMINNSDKNIAALETMRSIIPVGVREMSIDAIHQSVQEKCGLYTSELATEIKTNKLLHWIVTHPDDIATSNFLSGEFRQYFVNLEALDVVEMRALRLVLPDKFEPDLNGQKAEWRERFIGRLKQLVSQENGDCVKGGWDAESGRRLQVQLPALKEEQQRRAVYYYKTNETMKKRLKQYEEKEALLAKKQEALQSAIQKESECQADYNDVLDEIRDPSLKAQFSSEKLAQAKTNAARDLKNAREQRKYLTLDVDRIQKTISNYTISKDQFVRFMEQQADFLAEYDWVNSNESILIKGVFDKRPVIEKTVRSSAKFATAEQEAIQRKLELSKMASGSGISIVSEVKEVPTDEEGASAVSTVPVSAMKPVPDVDMKPSSETDVDSLLPPQQPTSTPRRGSVLDRVNPDMLKSINSMLSSTSERADSVPIYRTPRKDLKHQASQEKDSASMSSSASITPSEPRKVKSKHLKRVLELESPTKDARMTPRASAPQLSFLDQIKNKGKKHASTNDIASTAPPNFLEAIRKRRIEE